MSAISGFLSTIASAVYGEQVRGAIADAIEQCYSDVNSPSLQTEAFLAAITEAYDGGILDIQEVSSVSAMTNQNIIYRMGNQLYFHNGTLWVALSSGILEAATGSSMTDTAKIYRYTGNESNFTANALYYYNGSLWKKIGGESGDGISDTVKNAIATLLLNAAYTNNNLAEYKSVIQNWGGGSGGGSDMFGWEDGIAYQNLTIVPNVYINGASGEAAYNGWDATGFVPIDGAAHMYLPQLNGGSASISSKNNYWYTAEKTLISSFNSGDTSGATLAVPSNAAFFRLSGKSDSLASCISSGIIPYAN